MGPLRFSGMERMFQCSAGMWENEGWIPIIIGQGSNNPFARNLELAGYRIVYIRSIRSLKGLLDLMKVIYRYKPKVVHIHTESMHGPVAIFIRVLSPRANIVQTIHSIFEFSGFVKWKRLGQHSLSKLAQVKHVSVSHEVAQNEIENYRLRTLVIENWISDNFFSNLWRKISSNSQMVKIGIVGNCSNIKNHEVLLKSVLELDSFHVIHIGNEDQATIAEKSLMRLLDESDQISRLGERVEIPELLSSCDLFAMTSLHEGFGMALAEALSLGIPCLISNAKGLNWAHSLPGVKVATNDQSWSEILRNISNLDLLDLKEKAFKSKDAYRERWSASRGVAQYIELYDS